MKLQATFEKRALKIIDRLRENTGVKNRRQVLIDAIDLYNKIEKLADDRGKLILLLSDNTEKELVIPRPKR